MCKVNRSFCTEELNWSVFISVLKSPAALCFSIHAANCIFFVIVFKNELEKKDVEHADSFLYARGYPG